LQLQHLEIATLLKTLTPVPRNLVESWVRDLGERNQAKVEEVVDTLVSGLKYQARQQYDKDRTFDMTDIERFQELVFKIKNQ
jgi:hypothetical protein